MMYAVLMLMAVMVGQIAQRFRVRVLGLAFCIAVVFAFGWDGASAARLQAMANLRGLQQQPHGDVVYEIAERLRGTPGRLAHDLHPGNEQLGSSRIFEAMPFLCGKPIIEGGIVNSALGSLGAYSVQGQISDNPAGWPLKVNPLPFNPGVGFKRLQMMGVTHFVARSRRTQEALEADDDWVRIGEYGGGKWKLYELREEKRLDAEKLITMWEFLYGKESDDFQRDIVAWYGDETQGEIQRYSNFRKDEEGRYRAHNWVGEVGLLPPKVLVHKIVDSFMDGTDVVDKTSFDEDSFGLFYAKIAPTSYSADKVSFTAYGSFPHVLAMSCFPNWKVRGAKGPYLTSSGYMVVYPTQEDVTLYWSWTWADRIGMALTILGVGWCVVIFVRR